MKLLQHPLTIRQNPPAVREKLGSVMARLDRLRNAAWGELLHERWAILFE